MLSGLLSDVVPWSPDAPLPAAPALERPEPGGGPAELDEPDEPATPPIEASPATPDDSPAPSPGILIGRTEFFAAT